MDFSLTEGQQDLASLTRTLLEKDGGDVWTRLAQAGVLDAALPQSVGGGGLGLLEQCSILIELGRVVSPAPYLTSVAVGAAAIAEFGDASQVERWALPVLRGQATIATALEGEFSSDASGRISGSATAVPAAATAQFLMVTARVGGADELVMLDRAASGVTVTPQHVVDGTSSALLELDGVETGDMVSNAAGWARRRATVAWCAWQLGVLERALEMTADYARTRTQFDKPIGSFQAIRQRLADAYIDVEAVRLSLWQAAWREAEGVPADAEIATAKFWAAEAGHRVAHTAVHVHGGVGIDVDYPLHRYFTAAKRAEFALGGATQQLVTLGDQLAN